MPRKTTTTLEKILNSESRFRELVQQRNKELLNVITRYNAIAIDDNLLAGFLLFALNPENKDHPMLQEFMGLAKSNKIPSKSKQPNQKRIKKTN
jgi:phosphosulfolactate phosphohydrolase-like enzyme